MRYPRLNDLLESPTFWEITDCLGLFVIYNQRHRDNNESLLQAFIHFNLLQRRGKSSSSGIDVCNYLATHNT